MRECYMDFSTNSIADLMYIRDYDMWMLTRINVPRKERGKGVGSQLLKKILKDADHEGATICLAVAASDGLGDKELCRWYQRYGFEMDPNPEWANGCVPHPYLMRRTPQPVEPVIETILQADEVEFLRKCIVRCEWCGHLNALHMHSGMYSYCQVHPNQSCTQFARSNIHVNANA